MTTERAFMAKERARNDGRSPLAPGSATSLRAGGDRARSPKVVMNTRSGEVCSFWRVPTPRGGFQSFALQIGKRKFCVSAGALASHKEVSTILFSLGKKVGHTP